MRESHPLRRPARSLSRLAACVLAAAIPGVAGAQPSRPEMAQLALAADRTAYEAGSTARLAVLVSVEPGWHVNSHTPTFDYLIPTELTLELPAGWAEPEVRYPPHEMQSFAFADQPLAVYDGEVAIHADLSVPATAADGTHRVAATLRYQACNHSQCLPPVEAEATIDFQVGAGGSPANPEIFATAPPAPAEGDSAGGTGLELMLLLALAGGLLLNVMPCVLPVLSLKVFGLVQSAGAGRAAVARGGLATAAGILVSFWALAAAAVVARAAGAAVGWGIQFQQPGFVTFLAVIVVLFCLNLWGLFEIPLPSWLGRAGAVGTREGIAGHFGSGLFATLMATPCSAPFLGTAVSFALAQETPAIFAIFTAVGLGMASPYLLLAAAPGAARLLPRPGAWMEAVRGAMGFLLAAAGIWLFYVLAAQVSPERLVAVQLALLGLALFTWLRHRGTLSSGLRRLAGVGVAAAAVAAVVLGIGGHGGRGEALERTTGRAGGEAAGLIAWEAFDRARAEQLADGGTPVFVDVTADWCFTCKVNERLVLETPEIAEVFANHGVVPMKADWTNRDDAIASYLAEHGRYGIPFYLLYRPGEEPHVFSELLTKDAIVEVVEVVRRTAGGQVAER